MKIFTSCLYIVLFVYYVFILATNFFSLKITVVTEDSWVKVVDDEINRNHLFSESTDYVFVFI